jgi:hypothetical protein
MAKTPKSLLSEYLKNFNPLEAFTKVPALNIAERLPFPVVGTDMTTGDRNIDLQPYNDMYGSKSAIPSFDDYLQKVGPFIRQQRGENLAYQKAMSEFEKGQQLDLINQLYPTISRAAQEATQRNLAATLKYEGDSPKYFNIYSAQAGNTEANLKNAIANQAMAAAAMTGRYQGRNIGFG